MGAFETFVNANLGIRKPLILDVGHPTDSSKAAGVVGSEYVDTQTNNVYEKTGENNLEDWVFVRTLGDSLRIDVINLDQRVDELEGINQNALFLNKSSAAQNFSSTVNLPNNVTDLNISYESLGNELTYLSSPRVFVSLRFDAQPDSFYIYNIFNVTTSDFSIQFSDNVIETDCKLDILISASASQISGYTDGTTGDTGGADGDTGGADGGASGTTGVSFVWFDEVDDRLITRNTVSKTEDPALTYWEYDGNLIKPLESGSLFDGDYAQFFIETGQHITLFDEMEDQAYQLNSDENPSPVQSVTFFSSEDQTLTMLESPEVLTNPAIELFETGNNFLTPLQSPKETQVNSQYFQETGDYVTII
mgnify:CR=1 FL=1